MLIILKCGSILEYLQCYNTDKNEYEYAVTFWLSYDELIRIIEED